MPKPRSFKPEEFLYCQDCSEQYWKTNLIPYLISCLKQEIASLLTHPQIQAQATPEKLQL